MLKRIRRFWAACREIIRQTREAIERGAPVLAFLALASVAQAAPVGALAVEPVLSDTDAEGRRTVEVVLPGQPWHLAGGQSREEEFAAPLPGGYRIVAVWVFTGTYREDVCEALVEVVVGQRFRLFQASLHKEGVFSYDGWRREPVRYAIPPGGATLRAYVMGHATGTKPVGIHFGVRLELEPTR